MTETVGGTPIDMIMRRNADEWVRLRRFANGQVRRWVIHPVTNPEDRVTAEVWVKIAWAQGQQAREGWRIEGTLGDVADDDFHWTDGVYQAAIKRL